MTPPYQVKKVSNEGTSSPFIARLFSGILEFRDQLLLLGIEDPATLDAARRAFDRKYTPLYDALEATRAAAIKVRDLVGNHVRAVQSGTIIQFRGDQYDILETIDAQLSQSIDHIIDQSIVATKSALQTILREQLNLDIGFFFQCEPEFRKVVENLRTIGENDLAQYLEDVRHHWRSALQDLRVQHEHRGWSLENLGYALSGPRSVAVRLPMVLGMNVSEFATRTANRVFLFAENMMVYAMQRQCRYPIFVAEIPVQLRDPKNIQRFKLAPRGLDGSPPWIIKYQDNPDFV